MVIFTLTVSIKIWTSLVELPVKRYKSEENMKHSIKISKIRKKIKRNSDKIAEYC